MKDYLNTEERKQIISSLHLMTEAMMLVDGNTLNKDEKANLKRGFTFIKKSVESIQERLNPSAKKALTKDAKRSRVYLDIYNATEEYAKKKQSACEAAYEENKDYFKLVELILFYNCSNCQRNCNDCEVYKEFEERCIPEFSGEEDMGNCKYAYRSKVD
jgi:hypothetical protein